MDDNYKRSSKTSSRKEELRIILQKRDSNSLLNWTAKTRNPLRTLTSFQFDNDPLICMRAVEALGKVAMFYADNPEILRSMIRRFFWMMNDESGNVGWYAPEAIGETLRNVPQLIAEYAHMLPPFLIEEPFEKGTRIAIARIAEIDRSPFDPSTSRKLIQTLADPDPTIRGSSIIALKALKAEEAEKHLFKLENDSATLELYNFNNGMIEKTTVGNLVADFRT